jgi:hypothetical protein
MKTCDVCKRTDGAENPIEEGQIHSVFIGTDIDTVRVGEPHQYAFPVELCTGCISTVNDAIAEYLKATFGFLIRR